MRNRKKGVLYIENQKRTGTDFRSYNFEKAICYRSDFSRSTFEGMNMRAAKLQHCLFFNADLRNVNLTGADLRGCMFVNADLSGANLKSCRLDGANFDGAIIQNTVFDHANTNAAKSLNIQSFSDIQE